MKFPLLNSDGQFINKDGEKKTQLREAFKSQAAEISTIRSWTAQSCEWENTEKDRFTEFSLLNLLAFVSDRFYPSRERIKEVYKNIIVTSYNIWLARFCQMSATDISNDQSNYHRMLKARWLSAKANNTECSIIQQSFDLENA